MSGPLISGREMFNDMLVESNLHIAADNTLVRTDTGEVVGKVNSARTYCRKKELDFEMNLSFSVLQNHEGRAFVFLGVKLPPGDAGKKGKRQHVKKIVKELLAKAREKQ